MGINIRVYYIEFPIRIRGFPNESRGFSREIYGFRNEMHNFRAGAAVGARPGGPWGHR